jgi:T1SS-143 domain-containing protein
MATEIGVIKTLVGTAVATANDSSQRTLQVGDRVFQDEIITTGAAGAVEIEFSDGSSMTLGRGSETVLDLDAFNPQAVAKIPSDDSNVEALQQALLEGADPSQIGDATAAGAGTGSGGNEGTDIIQVLYEGAEVTPESGFETTGITVAFEDEREADFFDGVPTADLTTVLLDEDDIYDFRRGGSEEDHEELKATFDEIKSAFESAEELSAHPHKENGPGLNDEQEGDDLPPDAKVFVSSLLNVDFGADGPGDIVFNAEGTQPAGLTSGGEDIQYWVSADGHSLVAYIDYDHGRGPRGEDNGEDGSAESHAHIIFTAEITDVTTGEFQVMLLGPVDHPDGTSEDNLFVNLGFTISDLDGDTAAGVLRLDIDDDSPVIVDGHYKGGEGNDQGEDFFFQGKGGGEDLAVDEDDIDGRGNDDHKFGDDGSNTYQHLALDFGADGPAETDPVTLSAEGIVDQNGNALMSNGVELQYTWDSASDTLIGYTDDVTSPVLTISVDYVEQTGAGISVNLLDNLDHPQNSYEDNLEFDVTYTVTDFDGDSVSSTFGVDIDDDMPAIVPQRGSVDEEGLPTGNAGDSYGEGQVSTIFENTNDVHIPHVGTATSTIDVSGLNSIADLNVLINLNHTWDWDIDIFLISPEGTRVELSTKNGGSADNYIDTVFDDEASTDITAGSAPFTGSFSPEGNLSDLDGENPNGTWTLEITDTLGGFSGTLFNWELQIETGSGDVAGEALTAQGNLGISWGADDNDNDIDGVATAPADRSVSFDEQSAPEGLTSNGVAIVYSVSDDGLTLTATAGETVVFTVVITDEGTGTYDFTLLDNLDHPTADTEDDIDLSFDFTATDSDGDVVEGHFTITVDDDAPVIGEALSEDDGNSILLGARDGSADLGDWGVTPGALTGSVTMNGVTANISFQDNDSNPSSMLRIYNNNADHIGGGSLADDDNEGINAGETLTINFDKLMQQAEIGVDGLGNHFLPESSQQAHATWVAFKNGVEVGSGEIDNPEGQNEGPAGLLEVFTVDIPGGFDTIVFGNNSNNDGSNYEVRYIQAQTLNIVDEEGLQPEGNLGDSYSDNGDVAGAALTTSADLNILWGSDDNNSGSANRSVTFDDVQSGLAGLTSNDVAVTFVLSNDDTVLTAKAGQATVFTVTLSDLESGSFDFSLLDNLDHPTEDTEDDLNLTFAFTATDSDGDTVNGSFGVTVDDDAPVATDVTVSATIDEDDINTKLSQGTSQNDGAHDGSTTNGPNDWGPALVSGSVESLVSFGADEDGTFSLATDFSDLVSQGLESKGVALSYEVNSNSLMAKAGGRPVFSLKVEENGDYEFRLYDQLDHAIANGQNNLPIDLSSVIVATDSDNDSITLDSGFTINVTDDVPEEAGSRILRRVEEEALPGGNRENGDSFPNTDKAFGSVTGQVTTGADENVTFSLSQNTSGLPSLTSDGVAITYQVSPNGVWLRATANGEKIFNFKLEADGDYRFDLDGAIDHPAGNGENTLDIDLSTVIVATDFDGDSITLNGNDLVIRVQDDVPVVTGDDTVYFNENDLRSSRGEGESQGTDNNPETLSRSSDIRGDVSWGADGFGRVTSVSVLGDGYPPFNMPEADGNGTVTVYFDENGAVTFVEADAAVTLLVEEDGDYTVTLNDNLLIEGANDNLVRLFDGGIRINAADADGDVAQGGVFLNINIRDDVPVATGTTVSSTIDEDDINTVHSQGTSQNDGAHDGSTTNGPIDSGPALVSGSVASLVSLGADGGTFSLTTDFSGLVAQGLESKGDALSYSVVGDLLLAKADGGRVVFTLELEANGDYEFRLYDQLDHADGNGQNNLPINLSSAIVATDNDNDSFTLNSGFTINVTDDVPEIAVSEVGDAQMPGLTTQDADTIDAVIIDGIGPIELVSDTSSADTYDLGIGNADKPVSIQFNAATIGGWDDSGSSQDYFTVKVNGVEQFVTSVLDPNGYTLNAVADANGQVTIEFITDVTWHEEGVSVTGLTIRTGDVDSGSFAGLFTLTSEVGADDDGSVSDLSYALSVTNATSGLNSDGQAITLAMNNGVVEGSTSAGVIFAISVDAATGEVSLTQYAEIDHVGEGDDSNAFNNSVNNLGLATGTVALTASATITDEDGDSASDSQALDISGAISFDDDIPTISVDEAVEVRVPTLTTQDADTIDAASDTDSGSFAGLFTLTSDMGADDDGSVSDLSYALSVTNAVSGLSSDGEAITLAMNNGVIEGSTSAGVIFEISVDASGNVQLTQHEVIDHVGEALDGDATNNDVNNLGLASGTIELTASATITDGDGDSVTDSQAIDISGAISFDDDIPGTPADIEKTIQESGESNDTNLMIILDVSGSMDDNPNIPGFATRLAVAKSAIDDLISTYDAAGDVMVRIVTFHDHAHEQGSVWMTASQASSYITGLADDFGNDSTNFDAALAAAQSAFGDSGTIAGGQNVSYFLSDGQPTTDGSGPDGLGESGPGSSNGNGIGSTEQSNWETFLIANNITSHALGLGSGVTAGALEPIAYDGDAGTEMPAVIVDDLADLSNILTLTVGSPDVAGNLVTEGLLSGGFGADGPADLAVVSVTHNSVVYDTSSPEYDASTKSVTIDTVAGGSMVINLESGAYSYTGPANVDVDTPEVFVYTIEDGDGDQQNGNLTIVIEDSVPVAYDNANQAMVWDVTDPGAPVIATTVLADFSGSDSTTSAGFNPWTFDTTGSPTATSGGARTVLDMGDTLSWAEVGSNLDRWYSTTINDSYVHTIDFSGTSNFDGNDWVGIRIDNTTYWAQGSGNSSAARFNDAQNDIKAQLANAGYDVTNNTSDNTFDITTNSASTWIRGEVYEDGNRTQQVRESTTTGDPIFDASRNGDIGKLYLEDNNDDSSGSARLLTPVFTTDADGSTVLSFDYGRYNTNSNDDGEWKLFIQNTNGTWSQVDQGNLSNTATAGGTTTYDVTSAPLTAGKSYRLSVEIEDGGGNPDSGVRLDNIRLTKTTPGIPTTNTLVAAVLGNVLTDANTHIPSNDPWGAVDDEGADDAALMVWDGSSFIDPTVSGTTIVGAYGSLTIESDGEYSYTPNADIANLGEQDVFTYQLVDADGDTDDAQLVITIGGTPYVEPVPEVGSNVTGTSDDDVILGTAGSDTLDGGDGDDHIEGGAGADTIIGGAGDDVLFGGDDADTFVWNSGDEGTSGSPAHDTVVDFNEADGDKLDLSDLLSGLTSQSIEGIDNGSGDLQINIKDGGNTVQEIELMGVATGIDAGATLQSLLDNNTIIDS